MEMNDTDRQRLLRSALFGAGFWLLFGLLMTFMPFLDIQKPPRDFPVVKITLNTPEASRSAPQKAEEVVTPSETKTAAVQKTAAAAKPSPVQKAQAAPKPAAAASPSRPSNGLGIPNFSAPLASSRETAGEAEFLDFNSPQQTTRPTQATSPSSAKTVKEFEGKAAPLEKNTDTGAVVSTQSSGGRSLSGPTSASSETSRSLEQIAGQAQTGSVSSGSIGSAVEGTTSGRVSSVSGLSFDGTPRRLLSPEEPEIILPSDLARLVDSDRKVTVRFTVLPDGSVPGALITFTPSGILPVKIQDYLKNEFSRWRFEKSTQDGHATFQYSIKVL